MPEGSRMRWEGAWGNGAQARLAGCWGWGDRRDQPAWPTSQLWPSSWPWSQAEWPSYSRMRTQTPPAMDPTRYEAQTSFCMVWFMLPHTPQGPALQPSSLTHHPPNLTGLLYSTTFCYICSSRIHSQYLALVLHFTVPFLSYSFSPSLCPSLISIRLSEPTFQGQESIHIMQGSCWRVRTRSTFSSFLISPLPITFHLIQEGMSFRLFLVNLYKNYHVPYINIIYMTCPTH